MAEEAPDPTILSPFKLILRGEDTVNEDDQVVFADFSPTILPADTPDKESEIEPAPKSVSAPEPAPSSDLTEMPVQTTSGSPVQELATLDGGTLSPPETLKPDSSGAAKDG